MFSEITRSSKLLELASQPGFETLILFFQSKFVLALYCPAKRVAENKVANAELFFFARRSCVQFNMIFVELIIVSGNV